MESGEYSYSVFSDTLFSRCKMPQHVVVREYNPEWMWMYQCEKRIIRDILSDNATAIYHIGSTSVPGLAAKPIIDILVAVKSLSGADKASSLFAEAGYEWMGEYGIPRRRYLRKGGDERSHQIHIFQSDDWENIVRHIAFRSYLEKHEDVRAAYSALKKTCGGFVSCRVLRYMGQAFHPGRIPEGRKSNLSIY